MNHLEILCKALYKKIVALQTAYKDYQAISASPEEVEAIGDYEYLKKDLSCIVDDKPILEALNTYIQKRVEAIEVMSVISKYCFSKTNFLLEARKVADKLNETYLKSEYSLMYHDCYLNSSLSALNLAEKYDFIRILELIDATRDNELYGVPVALQQLKNSLTFKVLHEGKVEAQKIEELFQSFEGNLSVLLSAAISDALIINKTAVNTFLKLNEEWLQIDKSDNTITLEIGDWGIIDSTENMSIADLKIKTANFLHTNLIKEYANVLKLFSTMSRIKVDLDISCIEEDYSNLKNNSQSFNDDFKSFLEQNIVNDFSKINLTNLSHIPLIADINNISGEEEFKQAKI